MKIFRFVFPILLALVGFTAYAADLQEINLNKALGTSVARYATYQSTTEGAAQIALRVKYVGTDATTGSVAVDASTGDLAFKVGADGTADATVSTDGTIDVSGASENTLGEVVDAINASANWEAYLADSLRSDSSNNTLITRAETVSIKASDTDGIPLFWDSAVVAATNVYAMSLSIGPEYASYPFIPITTFLNRVADGGPSGMPWRADLNYALANATFGSGSSTLQIYAVNDRAGVRQEILLWQEVGAATTENKTWGSASNMISLTVPSGYRLLVRYYTSAAHSAGTLQVFGKIWNE